MDDQDSKLATRPLDTRPESRRLVSKERRGLALLQSVADGIESLCQSTVRRVLPFASIPVVRTELIIAAVLLFDWLTPLGIEAGVLYMAAVLSAVPIRNSRAIYVTAVVCSVLVLVGWWISPGPGDTEVWKVVVNRALAIGIIWATAAMAESWKRLGKRRLKQLQETRLLQQAAALSASEISFQQALENSVKALCDILEWPVGHVYVREDGQRLVASDIWHLPDDGRFELLRTTANAARFSIGEGAAGKVWQSGDALAVSNVVEAEEYKWLSESERLGVKTACVVPITVGGSVAAVIECFSDQAVQVDPDALPLAQSVGQQLGRLFERKRAEEALRESEQRLRLALEGGQMGTWSWDLRTDQRKWDRREDELLGLDPANTTVRDAEVFFDRAHPEDREELRRVLESSIQHGSSYEHEYRIIRPDGEVRWLAGRGEVRRNSSGQPVAMFGVNFDITRRKQAEQEINLAKEAAEAANQMRSQFVANVSHELRTPMNAILGMLQLTLEEQLTHTQRDWLETASDSAHALLTLVNDLLDFSKLESGQFHIDPQPFRLRDIIDGVLRPLSARAFEKDVELVCDVHPEIPEQLTGDSYRLRQVLVNLVGNAIKFTDGGEIVLHVELQNRSLDDVKLEFAVSDTGGGISDEDQQRIFEPFAQVDASSTRRCGGVGLGLTISNELVRRMGGELSVTSQAQEGSRFSFSLRFQLPELPENEMAVPATLDGAAVLVVDDNATTRAVLQRLLAHWNVCPDVAVDGDHAVGKLQRAVDENRSYAAIIVDAAMPGMDGVELAGRIAADSDAPPPVILMLPPADQRRCREQSDSIPVAAYLEKPVSSTSLLDALKAIFEAGSPESSIRPKQSTTEPANNVLSVLLVEDTPANQKVISAVLQRRGHQLTVAENGQQAVDRLASEHFDVVLMDVQMPVLDGYQATEKIRERERGQDLHVPIIAMTAHAMPGDRDKCLAAGMDSYLAKPIDVVQLIAVVESLGGIAQPGQHRAESPGNPPVTLDYRGAMQRLDGDMNLYREFIQVFHEDAPVLVSSIRRGVDENDAQLLERAAHSLKGLAASLGGESVVQWAKRLEKMGRSEEIGEAGTCLPPLDTAMSELLEELDQFRLVSS